jgi:preprotein translocase subunit YajC
MSKSEKSKGEFKLSKRAGLLKGLSFLSSFLFLCFVMVRTAFGMGTDGGGGGQGGAVQSLIFFGLIIAVFYFLMIRPQQKRKKDHEMMISTLRKGDKVVTNSGMFGTIVGMDDKENKVVLKVAENVKIEFMKSSIAGRMGAEE